MNDRHISFRKYPVGMLFVPLFLAACAPPGEESEAAPAEPPTAAEALLERSIEFHDPQGVWSSRPVRLVWTGTGSEGEPRVAMDMTILPDGSSFAMEGTYRGHEIRYAASGSDMSVAVDGTDQIPDDVMEDMRLLREDGFFWRSYFSYLAGLPMKLRDPGTRLDPEPTDAEFMGRPVRSIRVTYDPEVGGDIWYFYFDPETAELVGCRFYHDEAANDGEYIVFEGLAEAGGLALPARRTWYTNADDRLLGTDEISDLTLLN